jgi:hypothetical protein
MSCVELSIAKLTSIAEDPMISELLLRGIDEMESSDLCEERNVAPALQIALKTLLEQADQRRQGNNGTFGPRVRLGAIYETAQQTGDALTRIPEATAYHPKKYRFGFKAKLPILDQQSAADSETCRQSRRLRCS